jgi:hypothetical protein
MPPPRRAFCVSAGKSVELRGIKLKGFAFISQNAHAGVWGQRKKLSLRGEAPKIVRVFSGAPIENKAPRSERPTRAERGTNSATPFNSIGSKSPRALSIPGRCSRFRRTTKTFKSSAPNELRKWMTKTIQLNRRLPLPLRPLRVARLAAIRKRACSAAASPRCCVATKHQRLPPGTSTARKMHPQ